MNAVEIEEAVSQLASEPFDASEFPFAFLKAFGNKDTTIARLRSGSSNSSDIPGGVLQRSNIHIVTCKEGETSRAITALKLSQKTTVAKARFILTTDGVNFEAEDLTSGETVACAFADFPDHFGFFLPLAGISTVKQVRESAFDVRATGRLNKLYIELRENNAEWDTSERQHDMNHFMARLIFCFFAEDTDIFLSNRLFTDTIERMSAQDSSNTHEVIETIFRAMNMNTADRVATKLPRWADAFPYVNGGLFAGSTEVPRFSKIARAYLMHIGRLEWRKINPDIFGSMIQAVTDDEERGELGMHYTSVPNILKVLNPLFLDDLHAKLDEAADNARTLLNLRKRISRIRVFDPACGSGNFLVIAYKEMRAIEAEINKRRGEAERETDIPITNFRGIEIRDFPAEVARLALIIAEYQCDVLYRGQKEALQEFLPLDTDNWITCGNALRIDWLSVCPSTGAGVKLKADDLFSTPLDQAQIDFENEGGETYICGNPPYAGKGKKSPAVASDMAHVLATLTSSDGYIDLAGCWLIRASQYLKHTPGVAAFVVTNSICQGQQLPQLWPLVLQDCFEIRFAHRSFKWSNLASHNAGVTCIIVAIGSKSKQPKKLFEGDTARQAENISPYLIDAKTIYVNRAPKPLANDLSEMLTGSVVNDGGNLIVDRLKREALIEEGAPERIFLQYMSSQDYIWGALRYVISIESGAVLREMQSLPPIRSRLQAVEQLRLESKKKETREVLAKVPHKFQHRAKRQDIFAIIVPRVSSENREFLPVGVVGKNVIIADTAFELVDPPLWHLGIIASRIHLVWVATVCGKLKTDFRYSNSLGWNTFPVPPLTDQNKADLTRCAEDILVTREAHFPATVADLYDPENMPADLRAAHERNDEVLERIYIGRRFRNDTERLEKLFELYTKMISGSPVVKDARKKINKAVQQ